MGWQGRVRKFSTVDRVARRLGLRWKDVDVQCWRDNDAFWVSRSGSDSPGSLRINRDDLRMSPLSDALWGDGTVSDSVVRYDFVPGDCGVPFMHLPRGGGVLVFQGDINSFGEWFVFAMDESGAWSCCHLEQGYPFWARGAHIDRFTTYWMANSRSSDLPWSLKFFGRRRAIQRRIHESKLRRAS